AFLSDLADFLAQAGLHRLQGVEDAADAMRNSDALSQAASRKVDWYNRSNMEAALDPQVTIGLDGKIIDVNRATEAITGRTRTEIIGSDFSEYFTEPERARAGYQQVLSEGAIQDHPLEMKHLDGRTTPVLYNASLHRNEAGEVQGVFAAAHDMTERKEAEAALRRSQEQLAALFAGATTGTALTDAAGRLLKTNPALERFLGCSAGELTTRSFADFTYPDDREAEWALFQELLAGKRSSYLLEKRHLRKDGTVVWGRVTVSLTPQNGDLLTIHMVEDINAQKIAEDALEESQSQLAQSQRLETVGRLAGGIAHDFNNLLTAITGFAHLLSERLSPDDPGKQDLAEITGACDRAASLVRQLLAFSRRQILQAQTMDLSQAVSAMTPLLARLLGEDVAIRCSLEANLGSVRTDPVQIEQVIMNLAVNARDAMPTGGTLTIETANVELDAAYAEEHREVTPGPHVVLSLSDTGCGMGAETLTHLFEPFFTTKEQGRGTGLGLATVYGIVKQSGGHIWVYSEPGRGSTFKVYLPVSSAVTPTAEETRATPKPRTLTGKATVLLVEDEESVRRLTARVLRAHGYTVHEAPDGKRALDAAASFGEPIHLLLSDVVMPGMTGPELAERVREWDAGVRVLFTSGYAANAIAHHGVLIPGVAFLEKPFTPVALLSKVRDVLEGEVPG
ncbi:MAG: PAS domain S-box protein, partial [Actinobacteria bacterium]|nr:PAS domain S-box protein [Actinomycetota bacterium]